MYDYYEDNSRDQDELYDMIKDCIRMSNKLTDWESDFIDSIDKQICDKMLTERQIEILDKIWDRIT